MSRHRQIVLVLVVVAVAALGGAMATRAVPGPGGSRPTGGSLPRCRRRSRSSSTRRTPSLQRLTKPMEALAALLRKQAETSSAIEGNLK